MRIESLGILQRGRNIKLIARLSCGNEERDAYWRSDRSCRVCDGEQEAVELKRASCYRDRQPKEVLFNEKGQGEK